jgi:GT2 family glycosyltransferase
LDRFPTVNFIWLDQNYGFPGNVNRGMCELGLTGDVVISNDDVVMLYAGWPERVAEIVERHKVSAIGPASNHVLNHQQYGVGKKALQDVPLLSFFWIYLAKDVWDGVGPLDEDFGLGLSDDFDWCYRATQKGHRLIFDPGMIIWHWGSSTFKHLERSTQNGSESSYQTLDRLNKLLLLKKHPELGPLEPIPSPSSA